MPIHCPNLFNPLIVGDLRLRNRIVMAPMTRSRATDDDRVTDLQRTYYQQRSSAGLILTEGVHPSPNGKGYNRTPGIFRAAHVDAWRAVTEAVHREGGLIACQLMHCGRVGHPDNKEVGSEFLAPSPLAADAQIFTEAGMKSMPEPREMTQHDIDGVLEEYRIATQYCLDAGFDAIELHGAAGYLPAQFLASGSNQRNDRYGGSAENRVRFVVEILDVMIGVAGAGRVGLRISPGNPYNDHWDSNPAETYAKLLEQAHRRNIAWVHTIRVLDADFDNLVLTREHFGGVVIGSEGFDAEEADQFVADGLVDAVSFGKYFIANPDLPHRIAANAPFNALEQSTVYAGGGAEGYIDYPSLDELG